jgi:Flp pilus assembly pilin Flp
MRELAAALLARVNETRQRLLHGESGQGLVEYALIIAVVSLGSVVALGFLSGKIQSVFSKAGNSVNNVTVAAGTPPGPSAPTPGTPTITCPGGTCQVLELADADPGAWGGDPSPTFTYQWAWNMSSGAACDMTPPGSGWSNNSPGNQQSQTIPNTAGGGTDKIRVIVTGTNASGSASAVACANYTS